MSFDHFVIFSPYRGEYNPAMMFMCGVYNAKFSASSGSILTLGTVQFRSLSQEPAEPGGLIRQICTTSSFSNQN
jgi:hypothetical protein